MTDAANDNGKRCSRCAELKPLSAFYKDATKLLGVSSRCMECAKAATREWERNNQERKNANSKQWAAANKDKRRETARKYQSKVGREEMAAKLRKWRQENPEANRAALARRRARKKNAGGDYTADDVFALARLQRNRCACCMKSLSTGFHVDHVVPLSKGGRNDRTNLQLLCPPCNLSKNARDPVEFMQSRGFLC